MVFDWLRGKTKGQIGDSNAPKLEEKTIRSLGTIELNPLATARLQEPESQPPQMINSNAPLTDSETSDTLAIKELGEEPILPSFKDSAITETQPKVQQCIPFPSLGLFSLRLKQKAIEAPPEEACEIWRVYLRLVVDDGESWMDFGATLLELGEIEEAMRCFEKAAQLNPADGIVLGALGHCLLTLGRLEEAVKTFEKACLLAPDEEGLTVALEACQLRYEQSQDSSH